ncbi:uncharacterized protein LOC118477493 [Aplysia californica]|uniref:Uncharacterized protein LOC118477493 n=1 Tax=Aplysia californica TaxID=6500 RepID=A0ABM1VRC0_APLCA|nr:uncharacterized protein LOC118477493 [Aplysia californica]
MGARVWTHPTHGVTAVIGTMLNLLSLMICVADILIVPWFTDNRDDAGNLQHIFLDKDVSCKNNTCFYDKGGAKKDTWHVAATWILVVGIVINLVSFAIQALIFWPLVMCRQVFNCLLTFCLIIDFVGAYCKFVGAFVFTHHIVAINYNYSWNRKLPLLQLDSLPLGLFFISFLLEILSALCMIITTDKGPLGGPSHRERLSYEREDEQRLVEEKREIRARRKSTYAPDTSESRSKHLAVIRESKVFGKLGNVEDKNKT